MSPVSMLLTLLPAVLLQADDGPHMTLGAWIFMGIAWVSVTTLLVWSFRRVLGGPKQP